MELQEIATRIAIRKIGGAPVVPQDFEDMQQEAAIAIFRNIERGEAYALTCGINAALLWWRRFVCGWHRNDKPVAETPQGWSTKLPERFEEEDLQQDQKEIGNELDEGIISSLVGIFIEARARGGDRTLHAAVRDTQIVALLCSGASMEAVCDRVGIPRDHISTYRTKIRRILQEHINSKRRLG